MTARPLTFAFPMMSDLSERPPHAIPRDELRLEAEAELGRRRAAYPRMVQAGRLSRDEADRHMAIWAMLTEELRLAAGARGALSWREVEERQAKLRAAPWRWPDKVREIRRELALRRNLTPKEVEARRIEPAAARRRLEALDGLHWLYWHELAPLDWGADWEGVSPADARVICHGLMALRDRWLERAVRAGDRAACAYTSGYADDWLAALAAGAPRDAAAIGALAQLRPDLVPAAEPEEQAA